MELHDGIDRVLSASGISFKTEFDLGKAGRIDFMCDGGVGIEVKIKGGFAGVTRQLLRYAQCDQITELVFVTTRQSLRGMPAKLAGKRVITVYLGQGF